MKNYIIAIRTVLSKLKLGEEDKEEMVFTHTDGRTVHISEMTATEQRTLLAYLNRQTLNSNDPAVRMRRKIISLAHEQGWKKEGKADIARINSWCVKYGHGHKQLNSYTEAELPQLVSQFERAYKDHLKAV